MHNPSTSQLSAWSDFFRRETDPSGRADLARRILSSLDLSSLPPLDAYPDPSDLDVALVHIAAELAIINRLRERPSDHCGSTFVREIDAARRFAWVNSSPIVAKPSWHQSSRMVRAVRSRLTASLGREPTFDELHTAVRSATLEWANGRLSAIERELPEARRHELMMTRLRRQGLSGALERLDVIAHFTVEVRPMSGDAADALLDSLYQPLTGPSVLDPCALEAHRSGTFTPSGTHSQALFGPVVDYTCACGSLGAAVESTLCPRCRVTTGPSSVRATTIAHVALIRPVQNPLTVERSGGVPVIGPALRPIRVTGGHFEVDELDVSYRRFIVAARLEKQAVLDRFATAELEGLVQGELNHLVSRAQRRSVA